MLDGAASESTEPSSADDMPSSLLATRRHMSRKRFSLPHGFTDGAQTDIASPRYDQASIEDISGVINEAIDAADAWTRQQRSEAEEEHRIVRYMSSRQREVASAPQRLLRLVAMVECANQ